MSDAKAVADIVGPQAIEMAALAVGVPLPPGSGKMIYDALDKSGAVDKGLSSLGDTSGLSGNLMSSIPMSNIAMPSAGQEQEQEQSNTPQNKAG